MHRYLYIFVCLWCTQILSAQVVNFKLQKGACQFYNGHVYFYGALSDGKHSGVLIYKYTTKLEKADSVFVKQVRFKADEILQLYSDTLHNYLNIYLQGSEKQRVTVLRFNKKFEPVAVIEDVEVARLNNSSLVGTDKYYYKNEVFSVKLVTDSGGKHFFLNKYQLKSELINFDYEQKWQFPLERKFVQQAHVFYADKQKVFLYASVSAGTKAGNWVLKINATNGQLIKANRLNDKNDNNHYFFGNYYYDKNLKSLQLWGQKLTEAKFSYEKRQINTTNSPFQSLYFFSIDSLGEIAERQEFTVPVVEIKSGVKKTASSYIFKIKKVNQIGSEKMMLEADIYKSVGDPLCYLYTNSLHYYFLKQEEKWVMEKNSISPNIQIEDYYLNADKLNLNGKLCEESVDNFERLYYKEPVLPVKILFKTDELKNPYWLLSKSNTTKNSVNYSLLTPVKKAYAIKSLEDISKTFHPMISELTASSFIIVWQTAEGELTVKLCSW